VEVMDKKCDKRGMTFSEALTAIKEGKRVTRFGSLWADTFLELQSPDDNSKMTASYISITMCPGHTEPFFATNFMLFVDDWTVIEPAAEAKLNLNFTEAFKALNEGKRVRRPGWDEAMTVTRQKELRDGELILTTDEGDVSFIITTDCAAATDWEVVE
jgi:Protein of unknown function (DUF2829)